MPDSSPHTAKIYNEAELSLITNLSMIAFAASITNLPPSKPSGTTIKIIPVVDGVILNSGGNIVLPNGVSSLTLTKYEVVTLTFFDSWYLSR